jgi:hypothetical protein
VHKVDVVRSFLLKKIHLAIVDRFVLPNRKFFQIPKTHLKPEPTQSVREAMELADALPTSVTAHSPTCSDTSAHQTFAAEPPAVAASSSPKNSVAPPTHTATLSSVAASTAGAASTYAAVRPESVVRGEDSSSSGRKGNKLIKAKDPFRLRQRFSKKVTESVPTK